jgi:Flp pilus assembly protein CpaB
MKKKMKQQIIIGVLIVVAFLLYVQHKKQLDVEQEAVRRGPPIEVRVPKMIKAANPGQYMHPDDWTWEPITIPANHQDQYITLAQDGPDALIDQVVVSPHAIGSIIMKKDVMKMKTQASLSAMVPKGSSAFLLQGDHVDTTLFSMLVKGDYVDVVWQSADSSKKAVMFRHVKLLGATSKSVVLSLAIHQAKKLEVAKKIGVISLAVRSQREEEGLGAHEEDAREFESVSEVMQSLTGGAAVMDEPVVHVKHTTVMHDVLSFSPPKNEADVDARKKEGNAQLQIPMKLEAMVADEPQDVIKAKKDNAQLQIPMKVTTAEKSLRFFSIGHDLMHMFGR